MECEERREVVDLEAIAVDDGPDQEVFVVEEKDINRPL